MTDSSNGDTAYSTGTVLRRLLGYMAGGSSRGPFVGGLVLLAVSLLALVLLPWLSGQAINVITDSASDMDGLMPIVATMAVAVLVMVVVAFFSTRLFARLATEATYKLQTEMTQNLQRLSLNFFDRQPIGQLVSRVTNDMEAIALFYENAVSQVSRASMQLLLMLVVMFSVDWRLTLVALLVVPLMLAISFMVIRASGPAFSLYQERLGDLSGFQEETISGHKVLISNRRHDWAEERSEELAGRVFDVGSRAFIVSMAQTPLMSTIVGLQTALVLLVGGGMVLAGQTTLGELTAFIGFVALLSTPLSEIANLTASVLNAAAGAKNIFPIVDAEPTIRDREDAVDFEFHAGEVAFTDVDFSYVPGQKILHSNTFTAAPGEMIGICGPTGAGKSTIINLLTRYYDIDSGTIAIDGQELGGLTQRSLRGDIGVVLQEPFLFSDTVMNNLLYARRGATEQECIEASKQANAHDFITNLPDGYETILTERGANLSAGQRQMITIARAMVAQPKILVLDEATSNVDTRTEKKIQEGLRRLMQGRTSFVIAHRLATIRHASRIMVLNGGRIVEFGPHDELIAAKGFYYALYMSQFKSRGEMDGTNVDFVGT